MAENVFSKFGGHVQYVPPRVKSDDSAPVEYSDEDQLRNLALQRDLTAANLLENDILLDMLDDAIDDQMKEFALTVPELYEAASNLCGSPTVTWECYKKAKELLRIAPWIAYGYDPVQLTFTDKFQKRSGNVVFDCKQFNADTFQKTGFDPMAEIDKALGTDDEAETETPSEIEKKAQENQKKWALLVLFWDLIWGKPLVKPNITRAREESLADRTERIQKLRVAGRNDAADKLAKGLMESSNLPNQIMVDRPQSASELMWEAKSGGNPIEHATKNGEYTQKVTAGDQGWNDQAATIWLDPLSMLKEQDHYKDRAVPALASGFLLSLMIGFLGLFPKIMFKLLTFRTELLKKFKFLKKWPRPVKGIGKKLFNVIKYFIGVVYLVPAFLSNVLIEACIWLALKPMFSTVKLSDLDEDPLIEMPEVNDRMEVQPTPAGFISLDCFAAAQEIVNRVNQESVN